MNFKVYYRDEYRPKTVNYLVIKTSSKVNATRLALIALTKGFDDLGRFTITIVKELKKGIL